MVRISDILKRASEEPEPREPRKPAEPSPQPPPRPPEQAWEAPREPEHEAPRVSQAMKEMEVNWEKTQEIYQKALGLTKTVYEDLAKGEPVEGKTILEVVDELVYQVVIGNRQLVALTSTPAPSGMTYLCANATNVAILSIAVGLELGYNKSKLSQLGLVALLHDIGIVKTGKIPLEPRKLTTDERHEIERHPEYGATMTKLISGVDTTLLKTICEQEHERADGTGYPRRLAEREIHDFAKIVGCVDVFEACSHERSYRMKLIPSDCLKQLVGERSKKFGGRILKALIHVVGVYPVGAWVELNTNEIAKVTQVQKDHPLRPVVNILFDQQGARLQDPRTIDLAKSLTTHIKQPLSDEQLKARLGEAFTP